ncbi:protein of unknown function [Chryseobacterium sp. JV274]|nr:protein of unknown function [Chryseobacterium sp. JV274]
MLIIVNNLKEITISFLKLVKNKIITMFIVIMDLTFNNKSHLYKSVTKNYND